MTLKAPSLRQAGLLLAILGIGSPAILLPIWAWQSRESDLAFNQYVGWANILSLTIGAVGVILVIADRVGLLSDLSDQRVNDAAEALRRDALRQSGLLLAQLLSTDTLDSRAAHVTFQVGRSSHGKKGRRRSRPAERQSDEILAYYLNETRGRLVILGAPGTGKTVLATSLTVGLLQRRTAAEATTGGPGPVPCLLNLPSWNPESDTLTRWLESQIADRFRIGRRVSARLINEGRILPILDGLDEMDLPSDTPRRADEAVDGINDYIAQTPGCSIVVTCRTGDKHYDRLARRIRDAEEITVQNLDAAQIIDYVRTQCPDDSDAKAWKPVFDALSNPNPEPALTALSTPWRLTASVAYYFSGNDPANLLPDQEEAAHGTWDRYSRRITDLLMQSFVLAKISIHRKRNTSPATTIGRLQVIAGLLTRSDNLENGGNELVLHQWWRTLSEKAVFRTHVLLSWAALHIPLGALSFTGLTDVPETGLGWLTPVGILANYGTILMFATRRTVTRRGPIALRIGSLRSSRRALVAVVGIVLSTVVGLGAAATSGILYGVGFAITSATLWILVTASAGLAPDSSVHPTSALTNDRNFSILVGASLGAYTVFYYESLYGIGWAIIFALMSVIGAIFSSSYVRYMVAVCYGTTVGLPLRFSRFLTWCQSAGLLRNSGIGYQFRHQDLLEYLKR